MKKTGIAGNMSTFQMIANCQFIYGIIRLGAPFSRFRTISHVLLGVHVQYAVSPRKAETN